MPDADFFDDAVPLGFLLEPFILSDGGAGVCAADFLPGRANVKIISYKNMNYL